MLEKFKPMFDITNVKIIVIYHDFAKAILYNFCKKCSFCKIKL